jgi:diacylglycerol kinase family enzyme
METEVRQFVLLSASNLGEALALCPGGDPVTGDVGQANDRWFINAASFGFGAFWSWGWAAHRGRTPNTSRTPSRLNCMGSSNAWVCAGAQAGHR